MQRGWARSAGIVAAFWLAGCGISLDLDPQPPRLTADMDAGPRRDAGERPPRDAAGFDSAMPVDDAAARADGGMGSWDGPGPGRDSAVACTGIPCDVVLQCGCDDLAAPTCDLSPDGSIVCRHAGSVPRDGECSSSDECAVGLTCLEIDALVPPSPGSGVCTPFCGGDAACGGAGSVCLPAGVGVGVCTTGCDAVNPGGQCPGSLDCVFDDLLLGTYCRAGMGVGGVGTTCVTSSECDPGTVCDVSGGVPGVCSDLCYTDVDCAGGAAGACWHMWLLGPRMLGVCPWA